MKRIALIVVMALLSLEVSARSVHYFTYSQATRTVSYLNAQNEMMIYFGYEYELPTYVLVNEVWMERVNSSYYELWVYGWDAYTGDEIYMPLDLEGVWLFSSGRMYNAAQYLRFRADVRMPSLTWYIPPYSPYTRVVHRHGYRRTYHYDIHRHGWMPPAYTHTPGSHPPLPYYYMRHPSAPAPMPSGSWIPGTNKPTVSVPEQTRDHNPSTGTQVRSSHNTTATSSSSTNRTAGGTRGGTTAEPANTRSTTETRGTSTETRGTSTETRGTATETRSSSTRGTSTATETRGTSTTTETRSSSTRGTSTTPTRSTVESRSTSSTPARSSSTTSETRSSNSRSSSTRTTTPSSSTNNRSGSTTRSSSSRNTSNARGSR